MSDYQLKTNQYLSDCDSKDVISFSHDKLSSISKLKEIIHNAFAESGINSIVRYMIDSSNFKNNRNVVSHIKTWFHDGEECEILRAGSQGWQKGKLKINVTLEFIPDEHNEITSPLDDVRQELNQK